MKTIKAYVQTAIAKHVIKKVEESGIINIINDNNKGIARWDYRQANIFSLDYFESQNIIEKI